MNLLDISRLAVRTVVDMARNRTLAPGHVWTAIKGAEKYLAAIVAGDVARSIDAQKRVAKCDSCQLCTYEGKPGVGAVAMYCGNPLDPNPLPGTCSCLVGCLVNGKVLPGAKVMVASESCPSGRWGRVAPVG